MSEKYTCSICGDGHAGLLTDVAYKLPDAVWSIPEADRGEVARFNDDLCEFGERRFIRCVLEVPLSQSSDRFGWGAWAEVDRSTFDRYLDIFDEDATAEPRRDGVLANALPPYPDSLGSPVIIAFRDPATRPSLFLTRRDESRLARDQRDGIDDGRYHDILAAIGRR